MAITRRATPAKIKKYPKSPEMVVALKELLNQYQRGTKCDGICTLCKAVGRTNANVISVTGKCKECPWVQITSRTCQDRHFTNASRLSELPGWIGLYQLSADQNYPKFVAAAPVKTSINTLAGALLQLRNNGYDTTGAVKELTALQSSSSKITNAKYYALNFLK